MQFASFLAALVLHLVFIILSVSYTGISRPTPIDLDRQVHMVELVYLPQPEPQPPAPKVQETPVQPPPPPEPPPQPARVEIPETPRPDPVPEPRPEPKPEPRPEPKPEPKPEPRPEPPRPREPTREEIMAQELAALRQDVESSARNESRERPEGLLEIYVAQAEELIKRNWRFPRIGGTMDLEARIMVEIDSQGRIIGTRIIRSSGREDFDHSALRAIEDTGQLPPPPRSGIRSLDITFNLNDLS